MMRNKKNGKIAYIFLTIAIVPLLLFGIVVTVLADRLLTDAMEQEVEASLQVAASSVEQMLNLAYPGDYELHTEPYVRLYKGAHDLTEDYFILDEMKQNTGFDITLFYQDTRILTTIYDENSKRIVGTGASPIVIRSVLEQNTSQFFPSTRLGNVNYFCYYAPLNNSDGRAVGMIFVGKPTSSVNKAIRNTVVPLTISVAVVALLIILLILLYTRSFDLVLQKIRLFLASISTEDLNAELDAMVLKRNDEFGDIGRSAVNMQQSLRHMMDQDVLTEIYNRRAGTRRFRQVITKSVASGTPFSVCIGDIDFFKKVNDTYGHDCGDLVLKTVANIMREHMNRIGFVARWGGEEFLLVFDRMDTAQAYQSLEDLLNTIRRTQIPYGDEMLQVTMTFGLSAGDSDDYGALLRAADAKLYEGKTAGRNRIVL